MRIFKWDLALDVWLEKDGRFTLFDTWKIAYHSGTLGPKFAEGDLQSPEGFYFVPPGMLNPNSRFHLAFDIGYPNAHDRAFWENLKEGHDWFEARGVLPDVGVHQGRYVFRDPAG